MDINDENCEIEGFMTFQNAITHNVHKAWCSDKQYRKILLGVQSSMHPEWDAYPIREIFIIKRNKYRDVYNLAVRDHIGCEMNGTCFWCLPGYRFTSLKAAAVAHRMLPQTMYAKTDLNHVPK